MKVLKISCLLALCALVAPSLVQAATPNLSLESIGESSVSLRLDLSKAKSPIKLKKSRLILERACDEDSFSAVLSVKSPAQRVIVSDYVGQAVYCTYRARLVARIGRSNKVFRSRNLDLDLEGPIDPTTPIPIPTPVPGQIVAPPRLGAGQSECPAGYHDIILAKSNQARAASGLAPLGVNSTLAAAARAQSIKMASAKSMTHDGWIQTLLSFGYTGTHMAQNVAYGYSDPVALVDGWLSSPGHRANILDSASNHIGVGCVLGPDTSGRLVPWWTEDFGNQ